MKALTIRQPWATLIATGKKLIEYRTWDTKHRGALLVCAGVRREKPGDEPLGVATAVVNLVDIRWNDQRQQYEWLLATPCPVRPFPIKGKLGFFHVENAHIGKYVPEPFLEGADAAVDNLQGAVNPYKTGSPEWTAWEMGFIAESDE